MRQLVISFFQYIKHSPLIKLGIKLGLTVGALWFVFNKVNISQLDSIFAQQDTSMLYIPLLLLTMQAIVGAIRWRTILLLLTDIPSNVMSLYQAISISYIGMFFNNCLPGGTVGGDAIRVWIIKAMNIKLSLSIHSVIIDRMVALAALVVMVLCALPLLGHIQRFDGALLLPVLVVLLLIGVWVLLNIERFIGRYSDWPVIHQLIYFISNLRLLFSYRLKFLAVLSYAIVGHVFFCIAVTMIAKSLSIELTIINSLILIPPVVLISTLPISVGGWGIRELAMITMLGLVGIAQEEALILSLETGLLLIAAGTPGGLFWLLRKQKTKDNTAMAETK